MSKKKKDMQQATDEYAQEVYSPHKSSSKLTAKKDFVLCHNDYLLSIQVGDDLSDVPECYHQNLISEGVL